MKQALAWLLLIAAGAGCHKVASDAAPAAVVDTAALDALWALAPDHLAIGAVATPHGLQQAEQAFAAVRRFLAGASGLADDHSPIGTAIATFVNGPSMSLAELGLTHDKGAAWFLTEDQGQLLIVPVGDKAKLLAAAAGKAGSGANDPDRIADYTCNTIDGVYACARPASLLARIGAGKLAAPHDGKPRGDLELAGAFPGPPPMPIAVVAQLADGQVTFRGSVGGVPAMVTSMLGAPHPPRVDREASVGFAVLDPTAMLANVPPLPLGAGVTLADVAKTIGAPVTLNVDAGNSLYDLRVPLTDPAPATSLVVQCASLPVIGAMGARFEDGACKLAVPQLQTTIEMWVDGKELRVGHREPEAATHVALSPLGHELASGDWQLAMYGRGSILAAAQSIGVASDRLAPAAQLAMRALAMWNELDVGVKVDGDTVRFVLGVRTAWTNPADVVGKLNAISAAEIAAGTGAKAAATIAAAAPGTPFADDVKAGYSGLMLPTSMIGVLAAVAVPAFMDYMKKSKLTEEQATRR